MNDSENTGRPDTKLETGDASRRPSRRSRFPPTRWLADFIELAGFFWPFNEVERLGDLDQRKLLSITGFALLPLLMVTVLMPLLRTEHAYWLTALYFSVLWAILFHYIFPAPKIQISTSVFCFLGTGIVSISILLYFYRILFIRLSISAVESELTLMRAGAFILWVGLPEELCKVLMLYVLSRRKETILPKTMSFYGMICGLGFGINEGINYQLGRNLGLAETEAEYLFLNLIRLTTLPVVHAVWTGIAGFFLGFAYLYPKRRYALFAFGIGLPAVLHGLFNAFGGTLTSVGLALLSLLMLILYLSKHDALDLFLARESESRSAS